MALINTTPTFLKYLKVSFTLDATGLPDMDEAAHIYLIPVLGKTVYATLQAQVAATITWGDLMHYCRRVIAPAAFLLELSTKHIRLTDAGLKKGSSENTDPVFKWEYYKVEDELKNRVARALDDLWQHLYAKGSDYTWSDPSPFKIIFKTATDFNNFFPLYQPYRVFSLFKPIIAEVEDHFINGAIGEDFYNLVKAFNNESAAKEKKALELVKKAVAYYTIHKSVEKLPVKFSEQGLTVVLSAAPDKPYDGEMKAPDNQLSLLYNSALKDATTYMKQLKNFLNANASAELFAAYFLSDKYKNPLAPKDAPRNSNRKGVFGL